jgi:hypothetical protein
LKVKDIVWVGVRTTNFREMVKLYKIMGLPVTSEGADFAKFRLQNGHQVDVYSSRKR